MCELTSDCSNSSINGTESVYGYSMYFISFLFSFYPSFIFMSMKLFVCVCLSAYLHQYSNVCSVCTHSVATQLYTFIPQTLPVETTRYTITHRMHTHSCLCRYTLHLVATSAPLHTDQRSHSRFRPHSLSWFGEWTMRYKTTDWLLSNCQRIAMIKMKLTMNSFGQNWTKWKTCWIGVFE